MGGPVRWGILGTANIARASFCPAVREAGGVVAAVASRDGARARQFADANGVERALEGYETLIAHDGVEAVYIALPNSLHGEWTIRALRAGKTVLCEKPLCASVEETEQVLAVARETGRLLWEAFVFPFHEQFRRVREWIGVDRGRSGAIGELREIHSSFHFLVRNRSNIRLSPELAGGSLNDVGCYPVRLADLLFGATAERAAAIAWEGLGSGVDEEMQGVVDYGAGRRLVFSCGMGRAGDTFTRIVGTEGEIRLSNPFHPRTQDTLEVRQADRTTIERPTRTDLSFTDAIRHIQAVLRGAEEPRHLATQDSLATAKALALVRENTGA